LSAAEADFVLRPQVIHKGRVSEQSILLVRDGCGNTVEFKSIPDERVFATG
ncbi:MAG: glyoxalase, partial [Gammaproteobacteria bacterium]|nr:glyoxalase [Gammaproteobacteria bacterium]NIT64913.1 glyoxalase [Gammaproteobacteria bacterium]NIV21885.1 glyoxalase [Gammaproteobacteria bacterium]NIY33493.1 glyoxalase [Gammaproteobacteria bacterium]